MNLTEKEKNALKNELVTSLCSDKHVKKIVIFGSFVYSNNPHDMDVAVFQESNDSYLKLAMEYRRKIRSIANKIPIDIFPVRSDADGHSFLSEIAGGETVYER